MRHDVSASATTTEHDVDVSGSDYSRERLDTSPSSAAQATEATTARRIGHFEVRGVLGRGAMGKVLEGYDATLDRQVALKILHDTGEHDKRLLREAQALARLSHPNVVQVYEAGIADNELYVAMELIRGETLAQWQRTPRPWQACLHAYTQAGAGLVAAHAHGLVHRDFKPANCVMDQQGRVRVLDFGLVREHGETIPQAQHDAVELDPPASMPANNALGPSSSGSMLALELTRTGAVLGTVAYMAPEQLMRQPADAGSDQFSFCVALYEALYGHRPFVGNSPLSLIYSIQQQQLAPIQPRPGLPPVPPWLRKIVLRGLSGARQRRYPSMQALLDELPNALRRRRWIRGIALALVGVGAAAAAAVLWPREGPCEELQARSTIVWTPAQRSAASEGFAEGALAKAAWNGVESELDRYGKRFDAARLDACEATHVEHTAGEHSYELRLACLDRRMQRAHALVQQLVSPNPTLSAQAVEAVYQLPPLDPCRDAEALHRVQAPPAELVDDIAQIRGLNDRAWALHQAGRSQQALEPAQQAVTEAAKLGYDLQVHAEALYVRGTLHLDARRTDLARKDLHDAVEQAERVRDDELGLDVLNRLIWLETRAGHLGVATAWLVQASGKQAHAAQPERIDAVLELGWARLALARGEFETAGEHAAAAVKELRNNADNAALELARSLTVLGSTKSFSRDDVGALAAYTEALLLARDNGANVTAAQIQHDIGAHHLEAGQLELAKEAFTLALEANVELFGSGQPAGIDTRIALAKVHLFQGDPDKAMVHAGAAKRALEDESVDAQTRAMVMMLLGGLHQNQGDPSSAIASYQAAEAAFASMSPPDRGGHAMVASSLGDCMQDLNQDSLARASYLRALALLEAHVARSDSRWLYPLLGLGQLYVKGDAPSQAIPLLRRALEVFLEDPDVHDPDTRATIEWALGRALYQDGELADEAIALVDRAREAFVQGKRQREVREVDDWRESHLLVEPTPVGRWSR